MSNITMSKKPKQKTKFNMFPDWCYEQEQKDLDRLSADGWHLVKPGQHFHKYEQDTTTRYRYQMDYQNDELDLERYEEIYAEQGWELLGSSRGWHYFRKPYDPTVPEEAYEIFTDEESITVLRKRWVRTALIGILSSFLLFLLGAFAFYRFPSWQTLIPLIFVGIEIMYCFYSIVRIRHPKKQRCPKAAFGITLLYAGSLTLCVFAFFGARFAHIGTTQGHIHTVDAPIPAAPENAMELDSFEIYLSDNYLMNFFIVADASICFTIRNQQGDAVFTVTADNCHYPWHCIGLKRGTYTAYFSNFSGSKAQVYYQFK